MSGPDVWGPHGWKFIHYVTLGYPVEPTPEIKKKYFNFFQTLQYVIPCSICGNHYIGHLKNFPLTDEILSDKQSFINWGITMHNLVNLSNKKKEFSNEEGLREIIKNCTGDCPGYTDTTIKRNTDSFTETNESSRKNFIIVIVILILIILLQSYYINK